jgi:predicted amidohydrolase YtcJ
VEGYFFDDTKVKGNRLINVHDLDKVSKDHPVAVHHRGGHTAFYNSNALEMADINKSTPNPPGGTCDRDADGALNGRVIGCAMNAFSKVGERQTYTAEQTLQRDRDGLAYISKQFGRYGVTSVHHQSAGGNDHRRHRDRFRRRVDPAGSHFQHTINRSFSERTMALSTSYPGVTPPYRGNVTETQDGLNAWIERMRRASIQVNCHANGDVAIDMFMTAVERAQKLFPRADARQHDQRRLQLTRRSDQRIHYGGKIGGLRRPVGRRVDGRPKENQGSSGCPRGGGRLHLPSVTSPKCRATAPRYCADD